MGIEHLASKEELEAIKDVQSAREWAGVSESLWEAVDKQLGGVSGTPGLRVLASLPKKVLHQQVKALRVQIPGGLTRPATAVEVTQLGLMWRVARQALGLPDEDPVDPAGGKSGRQGTAVAKADKDKDEMIKALEAKLNKALAEKDQLEKTLQVAQARARDFSAAKPALGLVPSRSSAVETFKPTWQRTSPSDDDAVVHGLAYAHGVEDFYKLLTLGTDCATEIPSLRWNHLEIYDPDPNRGPDKVYTKHGAFLHDMEEFDHKFFGLNKTEVKRMDPQQRKCLEAGSNAFNDADIDRKKLTEIDTAVYVGVMTYDWLTLMSQHNALTMPDSPQMLANRVSFMLGLQGPSLTIDTACSSSLVATSTAVGEITEGRCPLSLALGVCYMGARDTFFNRCAMKMLSGVGRSASFNTTADGYCRGEAYGGLVLGRHGDAWHAWEGAALVAGSSVNEDGKSATLTAPNGLAQTSLLRDTHRIAGLMPHEVISLECAANGSALGDPIEFGATSRVHGDHLLVLSCGKTNKGHTEGGSGLTGLVKCTLMLRHSKGAPLAHLGTLNPNVEYEDRSTLFPSESTVLPENEGVLGVGVSAFGFGGTNAHAILTALS